MARTAATVNKSNTPGLRRETLQTQVLDIIFGKIMSGDLKMGDKLNAEELARDIGVSRQPVREALKGLEEKGLAETQPYVGTRLISLDTYDLYQIYLMRKLLEPVIAKDCAKKITDKQIQQLELIHEDYREVTLAPKRDPKKIYEQNRRFHFALYEVSDMDKVVSVTESLWDMLAFYQVIYNANKVISAEQAAAKVAEHASYIQALKMHDAEGLRKMMEDNLTSRMLEIKDIRI